MQTEDFDISKHRFRFTWTDSDEPIETFSSVREATAVLEGYRQGSIGIIALKRQDKRRKPKPRRY